MNLKLYATIATLLIFISVYGQNSLSISAQSGFYSNSFSLYISSANRDTVHYTLDGSRPTGRSAALTDQLVVSDRLVRHDSLYKEQTSARHFDYSQWEQQKDEINRVVTLNCASFRNGIQTSPVHTRTFFLYSKLLFSTPVISLVADPVSLFDHDTGIYVPGRYYDDKNREWTGNYFNSGKDWEREVHIEYFDSAGNVQISQVAGLRIHGGKTRSKRQKSLRLYARATYGKKHFSYRFLSGRETDRYKHLLLRSSMTAWGPGKAMIKDVFAHQMAKSLDIEYQEYQPVTVFINGEYWGIHTIRDRIDEHYLAYISGADKDSISLVRGNTTVIHGTNDSYKAIREFIKTHSLAEDGNYKHVCSVLDIGNYMDYLIAEMFFANTDWPGNNSKLWKTSAPESKWRWILYDLDAGLMSVNYNMFEHTATDIDRILWPNPQWSTLLFRKLIENDEFKQNFTNRFAYALNNVFTEQLASEILQAIKEQYEYEVALNSSRWNYPSNYTKWEDDLNSLQSFINNRRCIVANQLKTFFDIEHFGYECPEDYCLHIRTKEIYDPVFYGFELQIKSKKQSAIQIDINNFTDNTPLYSSQNFIGQNETLTLPVGKLKKGTYIQTITDRSCTKKELLIIKK